MEPRVKVNGSGTMSKARRSGADVALLSPAFDLSGTRMPVQLSA
jgi:hypothetical protein